MSEKKIKVPEGMWDAARTMYAQANSLNGRTDCSDSDRLMYAIEAALRWLSENPIAPTEQQYREFGVHYNFAGVRCIRHWVKNMFVAGPDPDDRVKDILARTAKGDFDIREAYARGLRDGRESR